jgi:hypothetical protein
MAMNSPMSPVMQQHDPNDDPFAALAMEADAMAPKLADPSEYGMGLKNVNMAQESPKQEEADTAKGEAEAEASKGDEASEEPKSQEAE